MSVKKHGSEAEVLIGILIWIDDFDESILTKIYHWTTHEKTYYHHPINERIVITHNITP